jgi:carbon storage regulator CsrA
MSMLVLARKLGEKVVIGDNITLTVVEVRGNQVRLAFDAPKHVRIIRGELVGNQGQSTLDPDLEGKPAEWTVLINPASPFPATSR